VKSKKENIRQMVNQGAPRVSNREVEAAGARVWKNLKEELTKHDTSLRSLTGDGWSIGPLEDREFRILSAVARAKEGTAIEIMEIVENWEDLMVGTVLVLLDRLLRREFVMETAPQVYKVTGEGERALRRAKLEGKELVVQEVRLRGDCLDPIT